MPVTATIPPPAPVSPGWAWPRNGAATVSGLDLQLSQPAATQVAGSAFYEQALPSSGLQIEFTTSFSQGAGGGGLCLVLADPTQAGPTALGAPGDGLGFVGIPGTALVLCSDFNTPPGAANYAGIATSTAGATGAPTYLATSTTIPSLRTAPHDWVVSISGGVMTVTCDGAQYLSQAVTLGQIVQVGFTASNGAYRSSTNAAGAWGDIHAVRNVAVAVPGGSGAVSSVFGRTGAVAAQSGDYTWSQVSAAEGLNVTAVKISAYTLAAGDWVPVNVSGGNVTLTLPSAPANGTRVGAKLVVNNASNNGTVSLACQGSDVFNVSGGPTTGTLSLTSQGMLLQYQAGIWYVQADDLPLGQIDLRYQKLTVVGAPTGTYATDVATVSAAITAAGTYGTLCFPYSATAYNVDGLAPLTGQTWYGNATLQRPASSSASIVTATGISAFTMRGLTIDGNASSTATSNAAIYLINTTFTLLQNLTIQNCPSANNAIILRGSVRGVIDACQITSCGYGIAIGLNHADVYSCYGNVIRNCMIDTTTWDAIFLTENLGSTGSVSVVGSVIGTVVTGCTVRGFGDCGIEIGSGTVHTEVTGCDFIGVSNGVGNNGILFRDAQHANVTGCTVSNLTKSGSTGVYMVNLNGNNAHNSVSNVDVYNTGYGYIVVGGTSPTTIGTAAQDIAINGGIIDTTALDGIQLANVAGFNITGTQVHNAGNQGISVGKVSSTSASDGTITGARIFNSGQQAASQSGIILFQSSADITITGCRIGDNQGGSKTQGYGIRIFDSTVTNVKITSCDLTNGGTTSNFQNASSAANGIEVYSTTGVSPVALRSAVTQYAAAWEPTDHGLAAWTYDPAISAMSSSIPLAGCLYLQGVQARAPFTTTKGYYVMTVAGSAPTAGQNWLGLYNSAGTLCASAALDSVITGATGLQTVSWAASFTGPAGQYWIALLFNAGTRPTLARLTTTTDNATPNAGLGSASFYRFCQQGTALTALPSPLTVASNSISSSPDSPRTWWAAIG